MSWIASNTTLGLVFTKDNKAMRRPSAWRWFGLLGLLLAIGVAGPRVHVDGGFRPSVLGADLDAEIDAAEAALAVDPAVARRIAWQCEVIVDASDPSQHVLAGDILSPGTTATTVATIVAYVDAIETPR